MYKRLAILLSVVALGIAVSGCTKCGWIWNDWGPKSCRSFTPEG